MNNENMIASQYEQEALRAELGDKILFDVKKPFLYYVSIDQVDIDEQDHVNNVSYVKWMEKAATAHSTYVGYDWQRFQELGASFFARRHEIEYLAQSYLGDRIVVVTWTNAMKRFTAERQYRIIRVDDGQLLVKSFTHWVYVDMASQRPTRMPSEMIDKFLQSVE